MTIFQWMRDPSRTGFTVIELMVIVLTLLVFVAVLVPTLARHKADAGRSQCKKNLLQIGIAFKTSALDSNDRYFIARSIKEGGTLEFVTTGEVFRHFQWMSNELKNPKVALCPRDLRRPARTFTNGFSNANVSYFVGVDANDNFPEMLLSGDRNLTNGPLTADRILTLTTNSQVGWNNQMHRLRGHLLLCDGSIQEADTPSLRLRLSAAFGYTNRLAIP